MDYQELVSRVNNRFASKSEEYSDQFWMPREIPLTEINLWTYWQGINAKHPRIMVVGQDWGAIGEEHGAQNSVYFKAVSEYINNPSSSDVVFYFKYAQEEEFESDTNLARYINTLGNYDVMHKLSKELFFTNLVPGCRKGTKSTGGFKAEWITEAVKQDFIDLVNIKRPQVILCLGSDTFRQVAKIYGFKSVLKGKSWNEYLDEEPEPLEIMAGVQPSYIFALPHPGYFGERNRQGLMGKKSNAYVPKKSPDDDWERIKGWLDNHPFWND